MSAAAVVPKTPELDQVETVGAAAMQPKQSGVAVMSPDEEVKALHARLVAQKTGMAWVGPAAHQSASCTGAWGGQHPQQDNCANVAMAAAPLIFQNPAPAKGNVETPSFQCDDRRERLLEHEREEHEWLLEVLPAVDVGLEERLGDHAEGRAFAKESRKQVLIQVAAHLKDARFETNCKDAFYCFSTGDRSTRL